MIEQILSPFYGLSMLLFPKSEDDNNQLMKTVWGLSGDYRFCPLLEFKRLLFETDKANKYEGRTVYKALFREMMAKIPHYNELPEDRVLATVCDLILGLGQFEACLEAALLTAGIKNDYQYYEDLSGVDLGHRADDLGIMLVSNLTIHSVVHRIKKLNHRTTVDIKPGEDVYEYIERRSIDNGIVEPADDETTLVYLDKVLSQLGDAYAIPYAVGNYRWCFLKSATLFAYIGYRLEPLLNRESMPWSLITCHVSFQSGTNARYLSESACRMKNRKSFPKDYESVDNAIKAVFGEK